MARDTSTVRRSAAALAVTLLGACATLEDATPPAKTITPMTGIGTSTFKVTAKDEQARIWFAQGLLLTYAFEQAEAARVFKAAAARDPSCAMCAWGVAYALGPNINNSDRGPVREIRRYIVLAQQAAPAATPVERALIDAMAVRYGRGDAKAQGEYEARGAAMCAARKVDRKMDPQELAYAAAMRDVVEKFPHDPDVVTLYADAAMSTSPWEWWDMKTGAPRGYVADVIERLRVTAEKFPQHTGALHFYVHIAEQSPQPQLAEVAADRLGKTAPESPHLTHMPSHIYKNIDRFADATTVNEQALAVQKRFDAALKAQGVNVQGNWDRHHLHFLWYAALLDGRTSLALQTARTMVERYGGSRSDGREYVQLLPLVTLVRGERWDEVLAEPAPPQGLGLAEGYWRYARGMAYVRTGKLAQARVELARFEEINVLSTVQRARIFGDPAEKYMTVARGTLEATIARADQRPQDAIAPLRKAAEAEDEIGGEPPMLGAGARIALAGALIEAGQTDEARKALDEAVRLNGPSAWTHQGYAQLAHRTGKSEEATRSAEKARLSWQNAERRELPGL
jgi:tetratricopeptide (TPR) repeat protein